MKRTELLALTGCNVKRFEGYLFRRQLPFSVLSTDERGSKRATYTLEDAFRLRVMMELIEDNGLDLEAAKYAASNCVRKLRSASDDAEEDLWLVFTQERFPVDGLIGRAVIASTLAELPAMLERTVDPSVQRRIVMVNASNISAELKSNADEWGIDDAQVDGPVWGSWSVVQEG